MDNDFEIVDNIFADQIEVGDQIVVDGDYIQVKDIEETFDIDEVLVKGYDVLNGENVELSLYADDAFDVWLYEMIDED